MKEKYYVYAYLDPRKPDEQFEYQPFYIGKGCGRRKYHHLAEAYNFTENCANKLKYNKIRKIKKETGKDPIIIVLHSHLTHNIACQYEKEYIKKLGRIDLKTGILTNLTDGGEGSYNRMVSQKTKNKISQKNTGRIPWNKGLTAEMNDSVKKYSDARLGKKRVWSSEEKRNEFRKKRSNIMKDKINGKDNPSWKEIDKELFTKLYYAGTPYTELKIIFNLSTDAIIRKIKYFNLVKRPPIQRQRKNDKKT